MCGAREAVLALLDVAYPGGVEALVLITMAVGEVVHYLAIVNTAFSINLPEDDATFTG